MTSALQTADVRAAHDASYPWLTHYPKDVDWHQNFTATPLYELLDSAGASVRFSCVFMVRRILETEKSFGNGVDPSDLSGVIRLHFLRGVPKLDQTDC